MATARARSTVFGEAWSAAGHRLASVRSPGRPAPSGCTGSALLIRLGRGPCNNLSEVGFGLRPVRGTGTAYGLGTRTSDFGLHTMALHLPGAHAMGGGGGRGCPPPLGGDVTRRSTPRQRPSLRRRSFGARGNDRCHAQCRPSGWSATIVAYQPRREVNRLRSSDGGPCDGWRWCTRRIYNHADPTSARCVRRHRGHRRRGAAVAPAGEPLPARGLTDRPRCHGDLVRLTHPTVKWPHHDGLSWPRAATFSKLQEAASLSACLEAWRPERRFGTLQQALVRHFVERVVVRRSRQTCRSVSE